MKISKVKFKNNNIKYSVFIGLGAIKILKNQIKLVCPNVRKVALIFDKKIPTKLKIKIKKQVKNYELHIFEYSVYFLDADNKFFKEFFFVTGIIESL